MEKGDGWQAIALITDVTYSISLPEFASRVCLWVTPYFTTVKLTTR